VKMREAVQTVARTDYCYHPIALSLAFAWEDLRQAFIGTGPWYLRGCVLEVWHRLPPELHDEWLAVVADAWETAEGLTHREARRLYAKGIRCRPPQDPRSGFALPEVTPCNRERGFPEEEVRDAAQSVSNHPSPGYEAVPLRTKGPKLVLLEGGLS
jgi:hypothetical protein